MQVEEIYKFHREEDAFWYKHFPAQDLLPEIGFEQIQDLGNGRYSGIRKTDHILLHRDSSQWEYTMMTPVTENGEKKFKETESGNLLDLAKQIYLPMYLVEGVSREIAKTPPIRANIDWYNEAMKIEARNNIRSLVRVQDSNATHYVRKEPFISEELRKEFYGPRIASFREVIEHEANLVEGLTMRLGEKPFAPTVEEALILVQQAQDSLFEDLKEISGKHNLNDQAIQEMIATADRHAVPAAWEHSFNSRDIIEQSIYDAHKTDRKNIFF